jgi:iron-sulfur cluster repair protein YtfE (RIC family)
VTAPGGRTQTLEPLPARLLTRPLDFIVADHHRHRVLCHLCDKLADAEAFDPRLAGAVADHIEKELADHVADEEQDLFPLLKRRAKREDEIGPVLERLAGDHAEDERLAAKIVKGLRRRIADPDQPVSDALRGTLRAFASCERRHLAIENAIVIPLAKVRLSARDQAGLAERMAARRKAGFGGSGAGDHS